MSDPMQHPATELESNQNQPAIKRECSTCGELYEAYCPACARFADEDHGMGRMGDR